MSVILVQPVRVSEAAQATTAGVRVAAVPERDEGLCCVGQIPEARTWPGTVPVDEDPSITVTNEIPGRQVVVADQLLAVGDTYDGDRDVSAVGTSSNRITHATSLTGPAISSAARLYRKGLLRQGYDADLIAVDGDLQRDLNALQSVRMVVLAGQPVHIRS